MENETDLSFWVGTRVHLIESDEISTDRVFDTYNSIHVQIEIVELRSIRVRK